MTTPAKLTRGPMIHEVKCWPEYFEAVLNGTKLFELRLDDRDYRVGDTILQKEYEPGGRYIGGEGPTVAHYTLRECSNKITWILRAHPTLLRGDVCAMSLEPRALAIAGLDAEKAHEGVEASTRFDGWGHYSLVAYIQALEEKHASDIAALESKASRLREALIQQVQVTADLSGADDWKGLKEARHALAAYQSSEEKP